MTINFVYWSLVLFAFALPFEGLALDSGNDGFSRRRRKIKTQPQYFTPEEAAAREAERAAAREAASKLKPAGIASNPENQGPGGSKESSSLLGELLGDDGASVHRAREEDQSLSPSQGKEGFERKDELNRLGNTPEALVESTGFGNEALEETENKTKASLSDAPLSRDGSLDDDNDYRPLHTSL